MATYNKFNSFVEALAIVLMVGGRLTQRQAR